MADDTWSTLALPALEEIASQERLREPTGNADVAEAIGAARAALNREMENLRHIADRRGHRRHGHDEPGI